MVIIWYSQAYYEPGNKVSTKMFSSILIGYEFPPLKRLPLDNKVECEVKKEENWSRENLKEQKENWRTLSSTITQQ